MSDDRTPTERYVSRMRLNAALSYAAMVAPYGAAAWAMRYLPAGAPPWLVAATPFATIVLLQVAAHRIARRPWLSRRAISALDDASADAALYCLYTTRRTSNLALQDAAVDQAVANHLQRLATTDPRAAQEVVRDRVRDELSHAVHAIRYARYRSARLTYLLAHVRAAAAIGGQRYVQPLADLAAIKPRNAGEEEVQTAAEEALRAVQARLGEAHDHLLRPAEAPGEMLLRPAEPAGDEALLRAAHLPLTAQTCGERLRSRAAPSARSEVGQEDPGSE